MWRIYCSIFNHFFSMYACLSSIRDLRYMLWNKGWVTVGGLLISQRTYGWNPVPRLDSNSLTIGPSCLHFLFKTGLQPFFFHGLIAVSRLSKSELASCYSNPKAGYLCVFECQCAQETHPLILMNRPYRRI